MTRVGILFGLNWFCPAQWVKPGLNQIKPGLSGQNWVKHSNVHYVSSTFLPSDPVCSKQSGSGCIIGKLPSWDITQYSALCFNFSQHYLSINRFKMNK